MALAIADLFEAITDLVPDRPALIGGNARLTYGQLDARSNRLANYLMESGVVPGDFVGVLSRNRRRIP